MKFSKLLHFSWLELTRYKNITLFLVLNLTLGLIGFFLLQIFQQSLSAQSAEKAQAVLGGDLSISVRHAFTDADREAWEKKFKFSKSSQYFSLLTMLRSKDDTRLASVGIFDSEFPLYGKFKLSGVDFTSESPLIWTDPEVREMMNLKIGDPVEIGEKKFAYAGEIVEDPTRLFRGVGFAPRVLISKKYLKDAHLLQEGSTFSEYWSYKIDPSEDLEKIKHELYSVIQDPAVNIESTKDSASDSNRVLKYFTDYLGLVALVSLGLCFLCGTYLLQWTFLTKKKTIAIYKTLGLSDQKIIFIYVVQNVLISLVAGALSFILVYSSLPFFQNLLVDKFNLPLTLIINWRVSLVVAVLAVIGPVIMIIPQLVEITELRPLSLLQNIPAQKIKSWVYIVWLASSVIIFWFLTIWQSHSVKIASIFTGSLISLVIIFRLINNLILYFLEKLSRNRNWEFKHALRGLTRKAASTSLVFTTMSLATMVLSLLPHIKNSIINEIKPAQESQIPSLFLFDIQPEQVDGIRLLAKEILHQDIKFSPLVRSRILKINEEKYERTIQKGEMQTREAEQDARFRNRGVNLTYRDGLQDSEVLVKGNFQAVFKPTSEKDLPLISLESDYADRVNVKIGDIVTFDIQGVEQRAQVSSLRKVRWTSFRPNFFILFPKGVLEEAPQIFLTSISKADQDPTKKFQMQVSEKFKNVSIIDIGRTIENSLKYIDQMAVGLQIMAWLAVLVGLFVFIVLLNTQIKERLQEMNLLQILGATETSVLRVVSTQFIILITNSVLFGVLLGLAVAWILIRYFFNLVADYDVQYILILLVVLAPVCFIALKLGLRPLKKLNPMDLIRLA
ncbi:MAG: ABC transporter permease [Pseudobdellovibrio sp.]